MSGDRGDLSGLADLALPPAVSFWPPAAGIWIAGGAAAAMLSVAGWRVLQRYRADAYLRAAIAEIEAAAAGAEPGRADMAESVSTILKRAAMAGFGREQVAALTGAAWISFLAQTAPPGARTDILSERLARLFAEAGGSMDGETAVLVSQAKAWLRGQRGRAGRA